MNPSEDTLRKLLKEPKKVPTIGRYQIIDTLGRGNMGEVFRARDPMIGRMVALKTRRFDLVYEKKDLRFVIDKFFEEARIAGNLIHPNIVTVFDVGRDGDYCFIAMEMLDGDNLTSHNKEDTLLPPFKVMELVRQVCLALDFAHSRNVIHRDIKPANLMFSRERIIKITDFGIATLAGNSTADLQVMGTPSYMSPEQTKGLRLTPQTDFFSLGVVFFELLVGRRPFLGRTLFELMENIRYAATPSILSFNKKLPASLDRIIHRVLEKEPELRYQSGQELASDIEQVMAGKSIPVRDLKATRKADLLKPLDFFKGFSRKEIEELIRHGVFIRYNKSQVIVREGEVDTTFFILLVGRVRVIKNNRKIADVTKGACFGEMGAVNKSPRTAHVVAQEQCIVFKLDLKVLERESPDLKIKFYQVFIETLIHRLEQTTRMLSMQGGVAQAASSQATSMGSASSGEPVQAEKVRAVPEGTPNPQTVE